MHSATFQAAYYAILHESQQVGFYDNSYKISLNSCLDGFLEFGTQFEVSYMMKVGIPYWKGRVSPVFDVAGKVLVIDIVDGVATTRQEVLFHLENSHWRANRLSELGVNTLVCGAISRSLARAVLSEGIEVISQTCGDVECVLSAFIDGRLKKGDFAMPGCSGRGRQRRQRCRQGYGQE